LNPLGSHATVVDLWKTIPNVESGQSELHRTDGPDTGDSAPQATTSTKIG